MSKKKFLMVVLDTKLHIISQGQAELKNVFLAQARWLES